MADQGGTFPAWGRFLIGGAAVLGIGFLVVPTVVETYRIMGLEPTTKEKYQQLLAYLDGIGIKMFTGSTVRSAAAQAAAVASGHSANSVSWHESGRAIDAYPIDPATGKPDLAGKRLDLFRQYHKAAVGFGFRSLAFTGDPLTGPKRTIQGTKGPIWDGGHIEYRGSFTSPVAALEAAKAGAIV